MSRRWSRVLLRQDALQRLVVALDGDHGVVDELADRRLLGGGLKGRPPRFLRDPEDVLGEVFVAVFGVGAVLLVGHEGRVLLLEGIGDVLQEDEAEDDVLVLGRVHVVPQLVGGGPKRGLEAEVGAVAGFLRRTGH